MIGSKIRERIKLLINIDEIDLEDILDNVSSFYYFYLVCFLGELANMIYIITNDKVNVYARSRPEALILLSSLDLIALYIVTVATYIFKKQPSIKQCHIALACYFLLSVVNVLEVAYGIYEIVCCGDYMLFSFYIVIYFIIYCANVTTFYVLYKYKLKLIAMNEDAGYSHSALTRAGSSILLAASRQGSMKSTRETFMVDRNTVLSVRSINEDTKHSNPIIKGGSKVDKADSLATTNKLHVISGDNLNSGLVPSSNL